MYIQRFEAFMQKFHYDLLVFRALSPTDFELKVKFVEKELAVTVGMRYQYLSPGTGQLCI